MTDSSQVYVREVGPRDGLQHEQTWLETADKLSWIEQLGQAGLSYIEITSFVSPSWIPALADADEVARNLKKRPGVTYAALVPNRRGLERALLANIDEVAIFLSASDTHNQKNINADTETALARLSRVAEEARQSGKPVRGYLSMAFGCPYEGRVAVDQVERLAVRLFEIGVTELSLGDTIGVAGPKQIDAVISRLGRTIPLERLALHPHNTYGTGLTNIYAAFQLGLRRFDGSTGGLGGCPYAPGASGNVATEDLVYLMQTLGAGTGIDLGRLTSAAQWIEKRLGRPLPSSQLQLVREEGRCL
ncbi:hydroxymethylglutaryl-CoA lyase [Alkalihalobacillus oceani]|uniref:hydroxymethylglutaryl-CoA lyase n=1 Tax=Halalkalibacter oceani TaxID=1653776 RepID=UPI00203E569E|nr:hydroxymethylglutaryl-CoA lyase [Halalkalibacter oceani]MCM3762832.1 hydroxymethylglutaryl-CoA lyase [Halalkalibacter oceani]